MVEMMYRSLIKGKVPDVPQLIKDIRSQRSFAVQTEDQYLYCYYAILQLLHIKKVVPSHFVRHFIREYENYLKLLNDVGGRNLPMQATSLPQPCANCSKVAAHMNDAKAADSPPSESKMDTKKGAKDDSNKKMKEDTNREEKHVERKSNSRKKDDSKRESASKREKKHVDVGSKKEKKRKSNVLKQLKTQKEKKEKKEKREGKVKTSGEPNGGTPQQASPVEPQQIPHPTPDVPNQNGNPNEDLKPAETPVQNQNAFNDNNNNNNQQMVSSFVIF
uniref:Tyrosine-protein phosphatase domain-containing protein n=1 Tax=Panagrolaimus superbus TaxID=310955 RepID=A0A914Y9M6_9BILA